MSADKQKKRPSELVYDLFTMVPEEDREAFLHQFKSAKLLRAYIIKYLSNRLDKSRDSSESDTDFQSPDWALKQADQNGERRALSRFIAALGGRKIMEEEQL
jgi:hypothetical protein